MVVEWLNTQEKKLQEVLFIVSGKIYVGRMKYTDHYNLIKQTNLLVCGIVCCTENGNNSFREKTRIQSKYIESNMVAEE